MEKWRVYERIVALLSTEKYDDPSLTVIPNARVTGLISNRKRQIDVLIDYRFEHDLTRRMVIDAKERKRPIDIKEVESFEGLMKDVGAQRGVLVCTNGYTKAAKNRAQKHIGIEIIPAEEIDTFNFNSWDNCLHQKCEDGLVLWDRYLSYAQVFGLTKEIMKTGYPKLVKNSSFQIDDINNITFDNIEIK